MNNRKPAVNNENLLLDSTRQMVDVFDNGGSVKEIGEVVYGEYRNRYPTRIDELDAHYNSLRRSRQVVNAALCEVAWRGALASMDLHHQKTGSLVPEMGLAFIEGDPRHSPSLHRFMATMQHWFDGALQRTLDDLRQNSHENGPYDSMHSLYSQYVQAYEDWRRGSSHPKAMEAQKWDEPPRSPEESLHDIVQANCRITAGKVIGVGLASEDILSADLDEKVLRRLEKVSDMTSLVKPANTPYFRANSALREGYSNWEHGEITAEEFCSLENPNDTDDALHPALCNGPLEKNASVCAGDGEIARPERFPVHPDIFLRHLGVKRHLGKTTLANLALISGFAVAKETIFVKWPK